MILWVYITISRVYSLQEVKFELINCSESHKLYTAIHFVLWYYEAWWLHLVVHVHKSFSGSYF